MLLFVADNRKATFNAAKIRVNNNNNAFMVIGTLFLNNARNSAINVVFVFEKPTGKLRPLFLQCKWSVKSQGVFYMQLVDGEITKVTIRIYSLCVHLHSFCLSELIAATSYPRLLINIYIVRFSLPIICHKSG